MTKRLLKRDDLLYPELSYQIIGILFEVYNELGYGYREKYYENAIEEELRRVKIQYKKQLYAPLLFKQQKIGFYYFDFLIDNKIILELKQGSQFSKKHIEQVYEYLKQHKLQLGIIAQFSPGGLKFKRVVNIV